MIEAGVPIVHGGVDLGSSAAIPVFAAAGLSYVPSFPASVDEYISPNVFNFLGGGAAQLSGVTKYLISDVKPERVGILTINVPQGIAAAQLQLQKPLEAAGIEVETVAADTTTVDFTPSLTALTANQPDALVVVFTGPPCGTIMQAIGSLGIDVPVLYLGGCVNDEYLAAGGAGAEGAIFNVEANLVSLHPDDPDVRFFVDAIGEYGNVSADDITSYQQVSFIATYALAEAIARIDGEITPESVTAAITTGGPYPLLMAPDYTCNGEVMPPFTALCNVGTKVVQYNDGKFTELTPEFQ
jgi:branched-chain amino acid transport system substrate-binding protein